MKTRTRFLAIAAATAAAVTALSGCAGASAEEKAETTAYGFMRAALHISDENLDDFLCTKGAYPAVEDNADSWDVSIDSTMQIEGGTWEVKATQTLTSENARPQYPVTLVVRADGSCVESIVGVEAESGESEEPESTPTPSPEPTPERVEFAEASIAFADLVAVAERGEVPVILLPASLDAAVILVGAPEDWSTDSFLRIFPNGDGSVTIKPQSKYDAFATPQDYVGEASGTIAFKMTGGDIVVEVEGVDP